MSKDVANPGQLVMYKKGSRRYEEKIRNYEKNIDDIVSLARNHGVPIILMTVPYNFSDWPPISDNINKKQSGPDYRLTVAKLMLHLKTGSASTAVSSIQAAFTDFEEDSFLYYLLGKAYESMGDYELASNAFYKAKDLDPLPWRVLEQFNDKIRELADSHQLPLVDIVSSFEKESENRLIGFKLVADNCHPTPLGNAIIARELVDTMATHGYFAKNMPSYSGDIDSRLSVFIQGTIKAEDHTKARMEYLVANSKYTMKTPFHNFTASKMYLDMAMELEPRDWRVWVNLATLSLFRGDVDQGKSQYRKAVTLRGSTIKETEREHAPHLKEALRHAGIGIDSLR